jgi:hypothetical protein
MAAGGELSEPTTHGGNTVTEREQKREKTGIELLLSEPEIAVWLDPWEHENDDDDDPPRAA